MSIKLWRGYYDMIHRMVSNWHISDVTFSSIASETVLLRTITISYRKLIKISDFCSEFIITDEQIRKITCEYSKKSIFLSLDDKWHQQRLLFNSKGKNRMVKSFGQIKHVIWPEKKIYNIIWCLQFYLILQNLCKFKVALTFDHIWTLLTSVSEKRYISNAHIINWH